MGYPHLADSYLLWITKSNLANPNEKVAGQLLVNCGSYDLANRDVD